MLDKLISWAVIFAPIVVVIVLLIVFIKVCYRIAPVDKVLIITGGKKPKLVISGGAFIIPLIRRVDYFDLCLLTVKSDQDEIRTKTAVPIVTDWTAQIRPDTRSLEAGDETLLKAVVSFKERGSKGIIEDVKLTLTGAVRDIVASMTPEEVLRDKNIFSQKVQDVVEDEMKKMGLEIVSLNIQDISDRNGYYDNLAAKDSEEKRREAENVKADADQDIRQKKAEAERTAKAAELSSELSVAEKERDNALKKAEFKVQTDEAQANAAIAGQLQATKRAQEVAEQEGRVEVVRQTQAELAANQEALVIEAKAKAQKTKAIVEAEADAEQSKIAAAAAAEVAKRQAQGQADAEISKATGVAEAKKKEAEGKADAVKKEAEAESEAIRLKGLAEAEATKAKGLAEADAIRAKGLADAEAEFKMAEARAANEGVNKEIVLAEIRRDTTIQVATSIATVMAKVGEKAQFIDMGGNGGTKDGSDILTKVLGNIPKLFKQINVESEALNGKPAMDLIGELTSQLSKIKGEQLSAGSDAPTGKSAINLIEELDSQPSEIGGEESTADANGNDENN